MEFENMETLKVVARDFLIQVRNLLAGAHHAWPPKRRISVWSGSFPKRDVDRICVWLATVFLLCVLPASAQNTEVIAWGNNNYGQTNVPVGLTNVVAIAGGGDQSLALKADGRIVGWGRSFLSLSNGVTELTNVVAIAAGDHHSLALKADGSVLASGDDNGIQPVVPADLTNVVMVAAGGTSSMALLADGKVVGWTYANPTNTAPSELTNVVAIAGNDHSLALKDDGSLVAWGDNDFGQTDVPVGVTNVVAIAAGDYHSLALKDDGTVVAWGHNDDGQTDVPAGLTNVVMIAAVGAHSLALKVDGSLAAWGRNVEGQTTVPERLTNLVAIAGGASHILALVGRARPSITTLVNRSVLAGGNVQFRVLALESQSQICQWRFNDHDITGATNSVLSLDNVQPSQAGLYSVVVSNAYGTVTSREARLSVVPLLITEQPQDLTASMGGQARFTIVVQSGVPASYQWFKDGTAIPGATNAVYSVGLVSFDDAGGYSVVVSNLYDRVTSRTARLNAASVIAWGRNTNGETNVPPGLTDVLAIAGGGAHSLALKADGSVVAWGLNDHGQTDVPVGLTNVVAIAAGSVHSLALNADGSMVAWGWDDFGQTSLPAGLTNVVAIAAGSAHSLASKTDGTVVAWGFNYYGQTDVPVGLTNVVAVAGGYFHSLALKADGSVVAWGNGSYGQTNIPSGLTNVVAIAAGDYHSLALKEDGTVVAWGDNGNGRTSVPAGLTNVVAIAGGETHSLALKDDGTVVAWGNDADGQTTVPVILTNAVAIASGGVNSLALVGRLRPFITTLIDRKVARGCSVQLRIAATDSKSATFQWRFNDHDIAGATNAVLSLDDVQPSQAGLYSVVMSNAYGAVTSREAHLSVVPLLIAEQPQDFTVPAGGQASFTVAAQSGVPAVYQWFKDGSSIPGATNAVYSLDPLSLYDAGGYSVVVTNLYGSVTSRTARLNAVSVIAWGDNSLGQSNVPADLTNVVAIARGAYHSMALKADGTVVAWGKTPNGIPNVPWGLENVVAIAGGNVHSLALKADGNVVEWGRNDLSVPVLTNLVAIAAGNVHSLALKADGSVVAWGNNNYGQTSVPVGLTNVVAIAAGSSHNLALKDNGTVVAWGFNGYGQTNVPAGLTNVVAIEGGGNHNLALKADGSILAWGDNRNGQTNVPGGLTNVVAIAAGGSHSLALLADGTVVAWGDNGSGQTNVPARLTNVVAIAGGQNHSLALVGYGPPFVNSLVDRRGFAAGALQFRIAATGSRPLTFQWRFNDVNIPQATNAVLNLDNVQPSQAGFYSVVVSNAYGSVASREARLSVEPLFITEQPHDLSGLAGGMASFTVVAQYGVPVLYQWLKDGAAIPGATNAVYGLGPLSFNDFGGYSVMVSNVYGSLTTRIARLNVSYVVAWGYSGYGQTIVPAGLTNVSAIAGGNAHSLALKADGSVVAWGKNIFGQTNVPPDLANVLAIAGGDYHSLALKANGTVVAWGLNFMGQTTVLAGLTNVVAIADGGSHSLALKADGTVVAWGSNSSGQTNVPAGLTNVVAIASGWSHSLALKVDGTVVAWGRVNVSKATVPAGLTNVVAIAGGYEHSLALKADGTVVVWSWYNLNGQEDVPPDLTNVVAIASGRNHVLALKDDGTVVAWGRYNEGQTSVPAGLTNVVAIAGGGDVSMALGGSVQPFINPVIDQVAVSGSAVQFRVTASGSRPLTCQWRFNGVNIPDATNAVLNLPSPQSTLEGLYSVAVSNSFGSVVSREARLSVVPALITAQPKDRSVLAGSMASFAVAVQSGVPAYYQWHKDGEPIPGATNAAFSAGLLAFNDAGGYSVEVRNVYGSLTSRTARLSVFPVIVGWGKNDYGQTNVPPSLTNVVAIEGGLYHSMALNADGTVAVWGWNGYGLTTVPASLTNVVAIAGGYYHNLALHADGTVAAWGKNDDGQTSVPVGLMNVVAIAAGGIHSLALQADGTVAAWGQNDYGQTSVPVGLTNVVAIAAGGSFSLALRADGNVVAWGDYSWNFPADLRNAVAIAGGDYHSLALRADGIVVAWGRYNEGQTSVPAGLTNVVAIAAGGSHSLALKADGSVVSWGLNTSGQANVPADLTDVGAVAAGAFHSLALAGGPPLITRLVDQVALGGGAAQFRIAARGSWPLAYQWRLNGVNIPGATSAALSLTNVQPSQEGFYSVVVSNAYGSVTNDGAVLTVLNSNTPPQIPVQSSAMLPDGRFQFELTGSGGAFLEVQARTNLTAGDWQTLNSITNPGGTMWFTDPETNHPQRFYRLKQLP